MKMQSDFFADQVIGPPMRGADLTLALVAEGRLSVTEVARLRRLAVDAGVKAEDLLITSGRIGEEELLSLAGELGGYPPLDGEMAADTSAVRAIGVAKCRKLGFAVMAPLPWRAVIAVSKPWNLTEIRALLPESHKDCVIALVTSLHLDSLLSPAEQALSLRPEESCRGWNVARLRLWTGLFVGALALALGLLPSPTLLALLAISTLAMVLSTGMKLAASVATLSARTPAGFASQRAQATHDPVVSLLVPLYHEANIAARLVDRLTRLERPEELLEILLVAEASDRETIAALEAANLPGQFRIIAVPDGPVRTKPHALNHAVGQAQGDIIGIYDAEDEPDPGQISAVVRAFQQAAPDVACIQGQLDFYNTRASWITRLFTLDYGVWFRLVLPGIARMGMVVPLGGTTLFFRREALERLGGWDDWNVTEDADLGVRLARHGWRCEVLTTVTHEEATSSPKAWIRQRSRWQKGYAMTWATHMARPGELLADLGLWRFSWLNLLMFGSLLQFALMPLLWSMFLFPVTDAHPLEHAMSPVLQQVAFWLFLSVTALDFSLSVLAMRLRGTLRVALWLPLLPVYYLMGSFAFYRAMGDMMTRPYHWQKTAHAVS
jgi:glycosyltransferase XagB